jgi:hypothetical protein
MLVVSATAIDIASAAAAVTQPSTEVTEASAPPTSDPFLGDAADDLANDLADVAEELDVCLGWEVQENGQTVSRGSQDGPDQDSTVCEAPNGSLTLFVALNITSESSEYEDAASWTAGGTSPFLPTSAEVTEAAGVSESSFLGDNDDQAVFRAVSAMALLASEKSGLAVTEESPAEAQASVPESDTVFASPGNDAIRQAKPIIYKMLLGGAVLGVILGLVLYQKGILFASSNSSEHSE